MRDYVRRRVVGMLVLVGGVVCTLHPSFAGTVAVVNGTRTAMVSLQMKSADLTWRGNVLRDGPLGVQKQARIFVPPDACVCDLKATFEDGHRVTHRGVNLCGSRAFLFTDF